MAGASYRRYGGDGGQETGTHDQSIRERLHRPRAHLLPEPRWTPLMDWPTGTPTPRRTNPRLLAVSICALLGWSAWARGGTVVALQGPLPWLGLAILVFLAVDRWNGRSQSADCADAPSPAHRSLSAVILFWAGLAFLVLLWVQWWNAGRHPYFHPFEQRWVFTPPPHSGLPWAVERGDAAEMFRWFFPAWAVMLALKCTRYPVWLAGRVAWFLVGNAGVLAAFGIIQALSGTTRLFWITPMRDHFFASFGYENHAASYFAMLFALVTGMLLEGLRSTKAEMGGPRARVAKAPITIASFCAVLCLAGMALSFSRAGMALVVGLSGVALILAARLFWPKISIAQRVAVVAGTVMGMVTFFFAVASVGGPAMLREASKLTTNFDVRAFMMHSAFQMWEANPWFGVGGWGYRHFLPVYALAHPGTKLSLGYANVHNDALQFLCEFGVVGFVLMLVTLLAFAWPLLRRLRKPFTPGLALMGTGLLAVLFHSQIDLPFRSPGILYAWLAVVGVSPLILRSRPTVKNHARQLMHQERIHR